MKDSLLKLFWRKERIIEMSILPKVMYTSHAIPIRISKELFFLTKFLLEEQMSENIRVNYEKVE